MTTHKDEAPKLAGGGGSKGQGKADTADCAALQPGAQPARRDGLDFLTLRALLQAAGWSLTRSDAIDGPTTYFAARRGKVRHLPDLADVLALAAALSPSLPAPRPDKKPARQRWVAAWPEWSHDQYLTEVRSFEDVTRFRRYIDRSRAGIVSRVRRALPADLVRWVDDRKLFAQCFPSELAGYPGSDWRCDVLVPFDLRKGFAALCRGRVRCYCAGGQVIGGRHFLVFELDAGYGERLPWRELWGDA